jgi:hypothetical protein
MSHRGLAVEDGPDNTESRRCGVDRAAVTGA